MSQVPVLRTSRVLLRGWRAEDREPFAAMNADPRVVAHLQGPLSRAVLEEATGESFGDLRYFRSLQDAEPDNDLDLSLGSFDFWRGSVGLTFRW